MNEVSLLEGLLRQYSPTKEEAPAVRYLAEQMEGLGFAVSVDEEGSLIGTLGSGPKEIVLLGHIDTVPGEIPVRVEGERLYGRGAVDAKGPLACFTLAAAQARIHPGWKLTVIGAVGEEGNSRGAKLVRDRYLQNRVPDFCVVGEPSRWDHITLGYKGTVWAEFSVRRELAHTASETESACEAAVHFWDRFQAQKAIFNEGKQRAFDQLTSSLRKMSSEAEVFAEISRLMFNLRLPPDLSVQGVADMLTEAAGDGKITLLDSVECYRAEKNTPLVRAFLAAIRGEGGKPGFLVKTGTADMNIVGPEWKCPILAYGPGDSTLDHTPDEHILISEYRTAIRVLANALERLMEDGNQTREQ